MIQFDAALKSWVDLLNNKGLARNSTAEPIDFKLVHNVIAKAIKGHVFIESNSAFDVIMLALIIKHFTKYNRSIVLNNPNQTILKQLNKFGLSHLAIDGARSINVHVVNASV
jgi:protein tyrosine/serine phosphatase